LKELDKRGCNALTLEETSELEQKYNHVKPRVFLRSVLGDKLSFIKYFPKTNEYFVYNQDSGIFTQFNPMEFLSILANMIANSPLASKVDPSNYSKEILRILIETESTHVGPPEVDFEYLSMKNGLLNLKEKKFTPHTPYVFLTSKVSYSYEPGATCPIFLNFLKNICGGHEDRVSMIRAWFHTVICGSKEAQVFFYLYGPAASGKTMLSNYLAALIGRDRVIYTTLKKLNTDHFELYNLRFKALIQISDSERYELDIPILKQLVGSDPIHASVKYVQGSFPLKHIGNLMIISNHEFKSKDNTAAIVRRIVPFCSSPRKLKEMAK
jgi:putative DNA primase/helicase